MDKRGTYACAVGITTVQGVAKVLVASRKEKLFEIEARVVFENTQLSGSNSVGTNQNIVIHLHP